MDNRVFLAQTDTTVGFLSKDFDRLSKIKGRRKKTLEVVADFKSLTSNTRVPPKFKNKVRRSKKSTFVYPNKKAFRVVEKESNHNIFLKRFGKFYSTSANFTGKKFEYSFAYDNSDIVIENKNGFCETTPSKIYKLNNNKIIRIR